MRDENDPELTPDLVLRAYASGIFPMAESADSDEIFWVNPDRRGVIPLNGFHIPRRLARSFRKGEFSITFDRDFAGVVLACADRSETWINPGILELYTDLFEQGHAHSVEIRQDGRLAGGLYGVTLGAAFFGESMFSLMRDASKFALIALVARLKAGGFRLLDTQFVTSHLLNFGAEEVPRLEYLRRLNESLNNAADFYALNPAADRQELLQLCTQTS